MADRKKAQAILDSLEVTDDTSAENLLDMARVAEAAERFEDMCAIMGKLVSKEHTFPPDKQLEERNMLSVAYKNVVGARRASWRVLKLEAETNEETSCKELKGQYKSLVEGELEAKCLEVLGLLEDKLVVLWVGQANKQESDCKTADDLEEPEAETQVFFLKMCGDYYRYLSEFSSNEDYKKNAAQRYETALELAKKNLVPTHPTRLGLALNASVCYYEILKNPTKACKLAKSAFDDAIQKLDNLSDTNYKDSTLIMQLLRDNLTIWTSSDDTQNVEKMED